ncbi:MAG: ABC-type branched-chain amino acid transport system, ATPase component [Candidatus Methanohalarchaeum thermophilum]|uniref:ABC-type branched-chain amino acid transport system, ATPase component n=1 Tax=Methanohalarchaeum thermophilum TaxID=1903181 RepID=A0A1Q6DXI9_METT1|nr:MAG: ABC-type branched-chain amino acid transport system, ATPase component [Candidatus Methanohalarchaeum thermophilum]
MKDNNVLEAKNLVAGYTDLDILNGVSIELKEDEIVSIIGPNGAGKSTLLKSIFGILKPRKGKVIFKNEDITGLKPNKIVKKGMSYVPQDKNTFPSLSVRENLEMGAFIKEDGTKEKINEILTKFPDLKEKENQKVSKLSGGQRQMVAMGRAMMLDPDALLLDEPSAGLAPNLVDEVFQKIEKINKTGTPILVVEQNARKILSISERGYVLEMGENRLEGKGKELLNNEEVEKLYLGG